MSTAAARAPVPLHRRKKSKRGISDEWQTPPEVFDYWNGIFSFTLDAAASHSNRRCDLYLTKEQDGLALPWGRHSVWCNPPYSRGSLGKWTAKAKAAAREGATVVMLIPSSTDTKWWHDNVWAPPDIGMHCGTSWNGGLEMLIRDFEAVRIGIHFWSGRISFLLDGREYDGARAPSAIVVYEPTGR